MIISDDTIVQYTFDAEEVKKLELLLQDPLLQAYLTSSFAQLRESMLSTVQAPSSFLGVNNEAHAELTLSFIGGAAELLSQIRRI